MVAAPPSAAELSSAPIAPAASEQTPKVNDEPKVESKTGISLLESVQRFQDGLLRRWKTNLLREAEPEPRPSPKGCAKSSREQQKRYAQGKGKAYGSAFRLRRNLQSGRVELRRQSSVAPFQRRC